MALSSTSCRQCLLHVQVRYVFALIDDRKNITRARSGSGLHPCASCNWSLHPTTTSAQHGFDPLQLALVVFSCHQLVQRGHLHLQWALPATCTGGVFLVPTIVRYYNMHT